MSPPGRSRRRRALEREHRSKTTRALRPGRSRRDAMCCVRARASYSAHAASHRAPSSGFRKLTRDGEP